MDKGFELIDKNVLEANICTNCNKLLNVPPIFCLERNQQVDQICGRCVDILNSYAKEKKWRQYVYENVGKVITYPCSNKEFGCNVILHWDEVKDHENVCSFQSTSCPLSFDIFPGKSCSWTENIKDLDKHIETVHKDCILNPPQFFWSDSKTNSIFFTHVGAQLVTVVIKFEKGTKYYCLLMINGSDIESQCFRYQVELYDNDKNNSIILRKNRLEPIGNIFENMKNNDRMLEIDLNRLKEMLKSPKGISGRFGVVKKNKKEITQITGGKDLELTSPSANVMDKLPLLDEMMLQELECPVCNEYMIPPIYICDKGHSICNDCKYKVPSCPNCRGQLSGTRNFTLEKLTTRVYYPCRNREIGCSFVTTSEKIRGHEKICELSENPCILKCGWKGLLPAMYNHLTEVHSKSLLQANSVYMRDIREKKELYNVFYEKGELFRLSAKGNGNSIYKFNLQHLGMTEGEPKFRYQLQIVDESPLGLNLSFTNPCQCVTDNLNNAHAAAVNVPWEMLKPFIFETRYFYYKIVLSKI